MLFGASRLADRTLRRNNPSPPERETERLGHPTAARPEGCLVWLHVSDPSDSSCLSALVSELSEQRDEPVFGLVTSAENAAPFGSKDDRIIHQLVPVDTKGSVTRFLEHWSPDIGIVAGPADRATLITEANDAGIPLFLAANTKSSAITGLQLNAPTLSVSKVFRGVLVPTIADQMELDALGVPENRTALTGPLRDTALPPPCDDDEFASLSKSLGGRPVWLAAKVTPAEIPILEAAQRRTIRAAHRLLLILVPRDTSDGQAIAGSLETHGWRTALRSEGQQLDENVQVYIADTDDGMGLWYRLSPITFLGGSFDPEQDISDPYGPATLGSAILHGPEVSGAVPRIQRLQAGNASKLIRESEELGEAVFQLLSPDQAALLAHAGWATTTEGAPALEALITMINLALDGEEPE